MVVELLAAMPYGAIYILVLIYAAPVGLYLNHSAA
jgi:hypothetical protein